MTSEVPVTEPEQLSEYLRENAPPTLVEAIRLAPTKIPAESLVLLINAGATDYKEAAHLAASNLRTDLLRVCLSFITSPLIPAIKANITLARHGNASVLASNVPHSASVNANRAFLLAQSARLGDKTVFNAVYDALQCSSDEKTLCCELAYYAAAEVGNDECMEWLESKLPHMLDPMLTALEAAARHGQRELVDKLQARIVELLKKSPEHTALATETLQFAIAAAMLNGFNDIAARLFDQYSTAALNKDFLLKIAAVRGLKPMCIKLIDAGAKELESAAEQADKAKFTHLASYLRDQAKQ